jgi:hypothetical protein
VIIGILMLCKTTCIDNNFILTYSNPEGMGFLAYFVIIFVQNSSNQKEIGTNDANPK